MRELRKEEMEAEKSVRGGSVFVDVECSKEDGSRKELGGLFAVRRKESVTLALGGSMAVTANPRC
jgi:hypothetical protein